MDVPTYIQASRRRVNGLASPIDVFVTNHEPKMYTDIECQEWRQELDKAISWSVGEMTNKLESEHYTLIRKLRMMCIIAACAACVGLSFNFAVFLIFLGITN